MTLIPVTKKGNKNFRGLADEAQIEASKGKLIPLDMSKFAADAAIADIKAKEEAAKAEKKEEAKKAEAKEDDFGVSPAEVKRSPSKG